MNRGELETKRRVLTDRNNNPLSVVTTTYENTYVNTLEMKTQL
jgi:hypothetical protein